MHGLRLLMGAALLGLVAAMAGACAEAVPSAPQSVFSASIAGMVTYQEPMALPLNAVLEVRLLDTDDAGTPATTIGEQIIFTFGQQVPTPFEVRYDPASTDPRRTYAVRAAITIFGHPTLTSETSYLLLANGSQLPIELVLRRLTDMATEFHELRKQKGHYTGGEFNPDLDSPGGRLRAVMAALGETLGQPPVTKDEVVGLMGEPDSVAYQAGDERLIYLWRGWHDYLYFVCRDGTVIDSFWWYAWE